MQRAIIQVALVRMGYFAGRMSCMLCDFLPPMVSASTSIVFQADDTDHHAAAATPAVVINAAPIINHLRQYLGLGTMARAVYLFLRLNLC
jgi:hypothetical protein